MSGGFILPFLKGVLRLRRRDFMKLHYNPKLKIYGRKLRKAGNLSEVILWKELKAKKLGA